MKLCSRSPSFFLKFSKLISRFRLSETKRGTKRFFLAWPDEHLIAE